MKRFILTCALWAAALLPRADCQDQSQGGPTVGCLTSLKDEDPKKFEICMDICQGTGYTRLEAIPGYECVARGSGRSFIPGYEPFVLSPEATATLSATGGAGTSQSDSDGDGSLQDGSEDGGQDASDDGGVSGSSDDTTMGDSQIPNEELKARKSRNKGAPVGAIAGGVVGGVVVLALVGLLIFFLLRRKRKQKEAVHHEAVAVLDKSRTSSPTSHASPIYAGAAPSSAAPTRQTTYEDSLSQAPSQAQFAPSPAPAPAPAPPPPPPAPVMEPQELGSREVDPDGVSVSSFDMQRTEDRSVPRLPVYHRDTPPGGSSSAL